MSKRKFPDVAGMEEHTLRANVYRLLADCYREPRLLTGGESKALAGLLEALYPSCLPAARELGKAFPSTEIELEDLRVAHAKLFIGPFEVLAPPYGSVYLEGEHRVMGDSTLDALDHYRLAGLKLDEDTREPPDHIGTELEFMYFLGFQFLSVGGEEYLERQKSFLANHLLGWVPEFTLRMRENCPHPFFHHLATLTAGFLAEEEDALFTDGAQGEMPSSARIISKNSVV